MKQVDLDGNEICEHKETRPCTCLALGCRIVYCNKCGEDVSELKGLLRVIPRRWSI